MTHLNISISDIVINLSDYVLGPAQGHRMAVWVQGCSLGRAGACHGCISSHTHMSSAGKSMSAADVVSLAIKHKQSNGLVITGGEPTDQPGAVAELTSLFKQAYPAACVLLYTGRTRRWIEQRHPELLQNVDVLIDGPFQEHRAVLPLRGSSNQRVHLLTPLGAETFSGYESWPNGIEMIATDKDKKEAFVIGIQSRKRDVPASVVNEEQTED